MHAHSDFSCVVVSSVVLFSALTSHKACYFGTSVWGFGEERCPKVQHNTSRYARTYMGRRVYVTLAA